MSKPKLDAERVKEIREAAQEHEQITHFQEQKPDGPPTKEKKEKKQTQAEILAEVAEGVDLFHDDEDIAYGKIQVGEHRECYRVRSKAMRDYLTHGFYLREGKPPNSESLNQSLGLLEAKARWDHPNPVKVYTRLGAEGGFLYYDLCTPAWDAVQIGFHDWKVVKNPPINFQRWPGMLPLPTPTRNGSLEPLRKMLNCQTPEQFIDDVGWLIQTLSPVVAPGGPSSPFFTFTLYPVHWKPSSSNRTISSSTDSESAVNINTITP